MIAAFACADAPRSAVPSAPPVVSENDVLLRAKGIVPCTDGGWIHFDYTPGEQNIRKGPADYTGRLCVIGSKLVDEKLAKLFGVA